MDRTAPLILTLALDERAFAFFEAERRRSFPPERNLIPAHLTLFHKLPGEHFDPIARDIAALASAQRPFPLQVTGLRSLGRGVAYTLLSPELASLRQGLAQRWQAWLGPQDRQKHQPHVTVQNKVEPQDAKGAALGAHEQLRAVHRDGHGPGPVVVPRRALGEGERLSVRLSLSSSPGAVRDAGHVILPLLRIDRRAADEGRDRVQDRARVPSPLRGGAGVGVVGSKLSTPVKSAKAATAPDLQVSHPALPPPPLPLPARGRGKARVIPGPRSGARDP
jgi:2'-5' RNA ligase